MACLRFNDIKKVVEVGGETPALRSWLGGLYTSIALFFKENTMTELNGSVNLLAEAMRKVFNEEMESSRKGMKADLDAGMKLNRGEMKSDLGGVEARLNTRIDGVETRLEKGIDTTNENVHVQLAKHKNETFEQIKNLRH